VYKEGARPDNPRAWLYRITHNEIANLLRSKRIRREVHQTIVLQIPQDKDEASLQNLASETFQAVQALREPFKEAISLHYFHGLSLQETAGVIGCPVGTLKTYVARGLQLLRKQLGGKLDQEKE
jgi:RNA polymerase sigma-70 factor (ECF subfamily)